MSAITRSVGVAAALALSALAGAVSATSGASTARFKPLQGLNLSVGSKHAIAYFLDENGACEFALVVGEAFNADEPQVFAPTRFSATIEAGKQARFDTGDGTLLEFSCAPRATAMKLG